MTLGNGPVLTVRRETANYYCVRWFLLQVRSTHSARGASPEPSVSLFAEMVEMHFATAGAVRHYHSQSASERSAKRAALPVEFPKWPTTELVLDSRQQTTDTNRAAQGKMDREAERAWER